MKTKSAKVKASIQNLSEKPTLPKCKPTSATKIEKSMKVLDSLGITSHHSTRISCSAKDPSRPVQSPSKKKMQSAGKGDFVRNPLLKNNKKKITDKTSKSNQNPTINHVFTNSKGVDASQKSVLIRKKVVIKRIGTNISKKSSKSANESIKKAIANYNADNLDEENLNKKKDKLKGEFEQDNDVKDLFPGEKHYRPSKEHTFKGKLKKMLECVEQERTIKPKGNLRQKMMDKLKAAQFRYLNEKLYTSTGQEAQKLFASDPRAFATYHEGYQWQLKKWPINPLDVVVRRIKKLPRTAAIADMGCGEAVLAKRVQQAVKSFDLVAKNPEVTACDMAHTPLQSACMDVAVYCLSLMGTELTKYLVEANRILKDGGLLLIAEVESRFDDLDGFIKDVEKLGFKLLTLNRTYKVFYFLEFKKIHETSKKKRPEIILKPCLYKRR